MAVCVNCGHDNVTGAKFCARCGQSLTLACPACGNAYEIGDLFCVACGAQLTGAPPGVVPSSFPTVAPVAVRRLVSVLYADLVGGTPTATEDDAERAVRAALDLVAAVSALGYEVAAPDVRARAGVVTGEAAVTI